MMFLFFLISASLARLVKLEHENSPLFVAEIPDNTKGMNCCFYIGRHSINLYHPQNYDSLQAAILEDSSCTGSAHGLSINPVSSVENVVSKYYKITATDNDVTVTFYPTNKWAAGVKYANTQHGVTYCSMHNADGKWVTSDGLEWFNGILENYGSVKNIELAEGLSQDGFNEKFRLGDKSMFHKVTRDEYKQNLKKQDCHIIEHYLGDDNAEQLQLYRCQMFGTCYRLPVRSFKDVDSVTEGVYGTTVIYLCPNENNCADKEDKFEFQIHDIGDEIYLLVDNTIMKVRESDTYENKMNQLVDKIYGKYQEKQRYINEDGAYFYVSTTFTLKDYFYLHSYHEGKEIQYAYNEVFDVEGDYIRYCYAKRIGSHDHNDMYILMLKCNDKECQEIDKIAFLEPFVYLESQISDTELVVFSHPHISSCSSNPDFRYMRKEVIPTGGTYYGLSFEIDSWGNIEMETKYGSTQLFTCDDQCYTEHIEDLPHRKFIYFHCGTISTTLLALLLFIVFLF